MKKSEYARKARANKADEERFWNTYEENHDYECDYRSARGSKNTKQNRGEADYDKK